ncbi:MAG: hypothetical protein K6G87_16855 [Butyrivibrio sp.]|uniref:hypothetical protein n=1 Tax=Butyrivibrio sp. TaxID=28121 RepID=UPI0025D7993F|nr:hypothetical protein [Butyrivibrio sp.]MCR5772895.1 hypothetical protein [Butyrivibrio sp.]
MYINVNKHILSKAIMKVAIIRILAAFCEGALRIAADHTTSLSPDMMDILLWHSQLVISAIQIIATAIIFHITYKKLSHYISLVEKGDRENMADLQKEFLGDKLPSLSVSSVNRLLQLWGVIFVGAELIYVFTSIMYRRFIAILMEALSIGEGMTDGTFVMLYNMTHGFKYIEILSAILLGVVITGIFLNDHLLKVSSLVILVVFLLSFAAMQMQTVYLMGREVGIVWTSLIYHATETIGLFLLALYLSRNYKGL